MGTGENRHSWSQPGAAQVVAGVHRIALPLPNDGLRAVNVYVVESADGLTLIDSGWALDSAERQLADGLSEIGHGLDDIARFLVTHVHRDHYTQAVVLRERFGMQVALGRGEQPSLDTLALDAEGRERARVADLRRCGAHEIAAEVMTLWGDEDFDHREWAYPDEWIERGTQFVVGDRTLDAIETPGHTRGHVVFRDANAQLLFAGDHVLPHITPSIGFESALASSPLADYLNSLRLLLDLPDTMLLPAHGPVTSSTHDRVDELLEHHRLRLDDTFRATADGASSARAVAGILRWTRHGRNFTDLGLFDQMLAVSETAAHLKVLVSTGRLHVTVDTSGVDRYEPA